MRYQHRGRRETGGDVSREVWQGSCDLLTMRRHGLSAVRRYNNLFYDNHCFQLTHFAYDSHAAHVAIRFAESFQTTIAEFGHIDIVINNAGIMNDRFWELEVDINLVSG